MRTGVGFVWAEYGNDAVAGLIGIAPYTVDVPFEGGEWWLLGQDGLYRYHGATGSVKKALE